MLRKKPPEGNARRAMSPIGSRGLVYLHIWLVFMVNVYREIYHTVHGLFGNDCYSRFFR